MDQRLIFRCIDDNQVEWSDNTMTTHRGTLAELSAQARGCPCVLAVAGETITLTRAKVPGGNRAMRLKAIPFALEDNLAEDVDELHFAVARMGLGEEVQVAAIRRETLSAWIESCTRGGINLAAVIPDTLLLPFAETGWSVLLEADRAVVRTGPWEGFAIDREHLALLLTMALKEAGSEAPEVLHVRGDPPPELATLKLELRTETLADNALEVFAKGYDSSPSLNLLQGPFSRKAQVGKWLRPWRAAAILSGIALALHLALQGAEYWHLRRQHSALKLEMEQLFTTAVPGARKIINPRAQLQNRLQELRQGAGNSETAFLDLLYRGGSAVITFGGIKLRGMRYRDNQLDLSLEGQSLETLDALKQRLAEQPDLKAEVRTTKREGKVESQVILRGAT